MTAFVALLRAINVGGNNKVGMEEFREHLTAAGLDDVQTYIASGNVVFSADQDVAILRDGIDGLLQDKFCLQGQRTVLRDARQFQRVIKQNPYVFAARDRPNMLHVHFLMQPPRDGAEVALTSYKGVEKMRLDGDVLYIDYLDGVGQSQLTPRFLEQALGTMGTSRNWNTVLKLNEMLSVLSQ
jgi:uncharacterized protein (DUF1697 family)